MHRKVYRLTGR